MQTLCADSVLRLELKYVHVIKEEQILYAILKPEIFVYNWQKLKEISLKNEYFIDNSLLVIVLQTVLYAFLFLGIWYL